MCLETALKFCIVDHSRQVKGGITDYGIIMMASHLSLNFLLYKNKGVNLYYYTFYYMYIYLTNLNGINTSCISTSANYLFVKLWV